MRVLHVVRSNGFAGVERHIAILARAQSVAGHEVVVVGGDRHRMRQALKDSTARSYSGSTLLEAFSQVRVYQGGADIVHAHMTAGEVAAVLGAPSKPIVTTRHFARKRGASVLAKGVSVLLRRRINAQMAISEYVKRAVDGAATVVYAGVPEPAQVEVPQERTVLLVQRLEPEKEAEVALRAFAAANVAGWRLQVAGRGSELPALTELAQRLGVHGSVDFLGHQDDVASVMQRAAVFVSACRVEGLGMSVLEAMSHGLPVVASGAGGHVETVGRAPRNFLFAPGDWEQAAEHLEALCEDKALRRRHGNELRSVQRSRFAISAQVANTDAVYRSVFE